MPLSSFDKYFLNLPPFDRQSDFNDFWKDAIADSKKIPMKPDVVKNQRKSTHRFTVYDIKYAGDKNSSAKAELLIPRGAVKPRPIIHLHDYNSFTEIDHKFLEAPAAYLFVTMRGHDKLTAAPAGEEQKSPGLMTENIADKNSYYLKSVFIDLYRAIEILRLMPDVDCTQAGIFGKGIGAAAAGFAAAYSQRITAAVFDTPGFSFLSLSQNLSTSESTAEINAYIEDHQARKKGIKNNLTYFDLLNFSDMIKCDSLVTVGFKDTISPPECVFAFFNHLLCEKTIEVYPDEGNSSGGMEQFIKSSQWLHARINSGRFS